MTIPGFGRLTSIQADMLLLAGYRLTRDPELNQTPIPNEERAQLMCQGLQSLRRATGKDFGLDLSAWERYLLSAPELGYRQPYALAETRKKVAVAIADPERARIVQKLTEPGGPGKGDGPDPNKR
jgi:hypothetical protein